MISQCHGLLTNRPVSGHVCCHDRHGGDFHIRNMGIAVCEGRQPARGVACWCSGVMTLRLWSSCARALSVLWISVLQVDCDLITCSYGILIPVVGVPPSDMTRFMYLRFILGSGVLWPQAAQFADICGAPGPTQRRERAMQVTDTRDLWWRHGDVWR